MNVFMKIQATLGVAVLWLAVAYVAGGIKFFYLILWIFAIFSTGFFMKWVWDLK